jgi:hypothetical protein
MIGEKLNLWQIEEIFKEGKNNRDSKKLFEAGIEMINFIKFGTEEEIENSKEKIQNLLDEVIKEIDRNDFPHHLKGEIFVREILKEGKKLKDLGIFEKWAKNLIDWGIKEGKINIVLLLSREIGRELSEEEIYKMFLNSTKNDYPGGLFERENLSLIKTLNPDHQKKIILNILRKGIYEGYYSIINNLAKEFKIIGEDENIKEIIVKKIFEMFFPE